MKHLPLLAAALVVLCTAPLALAAEGDAAEVDVDGLRKAVTLYSSFDEGLEADLAPGGGRVKTRFDGREEKEDYEFTEGHDPHKFRIAKRRGVHGGALECADVLPRRGRLSYPARGNLAYNDDGWAGSVSVWINTNPNKLLKTDWCDPVQITERGATNGGIWFDFTPDEPRDLRLGTFPALAAGEKPAKDEAEQPVYRHKAPDFVSGEWHHVAVTWKNFDTGKANAEATLYIDGKAVGSVRGHDVHMDWDLDKARIYFAVNFIGLMDELAVFGRALSPGEVMYLHGHPGCLSVLERNGGRGKRRKATGPLGPLLERLDATVSKRKLTADEPETTRLRGSVRALLEGEHGPPVAEQAVALLLKLPPADDSPPAAPEFPFDARAAREYQRAYADWLGLPVEFRNGLGQTFVLVPPGTFVMGSPADEPGHRTEPFGETQHPVRLTRAFYLGREEVTVGQFREFVEATGYVTDGKRNGGGHAHDERAVWKHRPGTHWRKPGYAGPYEQADDHPAVHVSHADAREFCEWLGERTGLAGDAAAYDLPSEAQWEWACRAGSGAAYWWGEEPDETGERLNVGDRTLKEVHPEWPRKIMPMDDGHAFPAPVGSYRPNAFGLYDMLGNVWEFCSTHYGTFPAELATDPGHLDAERGFAVRGGGWSNEPTDARCATRNADPPHFCHSNLGFRVALVLRAR